MLKIIGLALVMLLMGCVSSSTPENTPPSGFNTTGQPTQQVGKQSTAPQMESNGTARDILVKAKNNLVNARYQVTYEDIDLFGKLKVTEAKTDKFLAKHSTSGFGESDEYYDGSSWVQCSTQTIQEPFAQAGKVITECKPDEGDPSIYSNFAESILTMEMNGGVLTFGKSVASGKIVGRNCDQIELHMDSTNVVGKDGGTEADAVFCLDKELGIPLYWKVTGQSQLGPITIETQAEKVSTTVDESFFATPTDALMPGCGMENQSCCNGSICAVENMCTNGMCGACGTDGNPCCENNTCNYDEQCIEGICKL